jgi:hypothetical protein
VFTSFIAISELVKTTLQRQNTEILIQIFPEKEYRGLSPNFHIHASVSDLYIPCTIGLSILLEEICKPLLGLYKSLTDTWMWKLGLRPRYSQKRNTKMGFSLQYIEGIDFNKPKYKCRLCSVRSTWQQTWCIIYYCTMYSNIWYQNQKKGIVKKTPLFIVVVGTVSNTISWQLTQWCGCPTFTVYIHLNHHIHTVHSSVDIRRGSLLFLFYKLTFAASTVYVRKIPVWVKNPRKWNTFLVYCSSIMQLQVALRTKIFLSLGFNKE